MYRRLSQCSRILILRFFSYLKNMTFTFFGNDVTKSRKKSLAKVKTSGFIINVSEQRAFETKNLAGL